MQMVAPLWRKLEAEQPGFVYQRLTWNEAWFSTIGAAENIAPALVTLHDGHHHALLVLGIGNRHGLRIVRYAGGAHSNANGPLAPRDFQWPDTQSGITALLEKIGAAIGSADAMHLQAQPEWLNGRAHPFAAGPRIAGPNSFFEGALSSNYAALAVERQSNDARKKMRNKERRLKERGELAYIKPQTVSAARKILSDFFLQRNERFKKQGIINPFGNPAAEKFIDALVCGHFGTADAAVTLCALTLDGECIAIFGGAKDRQRYSGMFTSFKEDADIGKYSPGEQLLSHIVEDCCTHGLTIFDLGLGEARYKRLWCDKEIPTFESHVALSAKGRLYLIKEQAVTQAKRTIKTNPVLMSLYKKLRPAIG